MNLIKNNLTDKFNQTLDFRLRTCRFIRNRNNALCRIDEVIMDSTCISKESTFINIDSMQKFVHNQSLIDYDSNLKEIGVKEFTWSNCIDMFQSDIFLQTHGIEHNKRMIEYFHSQSTNIDIQQIPFLLDQNHRLQTIKNTRFPTEESHSSLHSSISEWLGKSGQKPIKEWLEKSGLKQQTFLTYFQEVICRNPSSSITSMDAIETIEKIFKLFQTQDIKKDLSRLKQLKLLTTRGSLIPAECCFFSDQYEPEMLLEEYLKVKEDRFLSFKYVTGEEKADLFQWRQLFSLMGVQEALHTIEFPHKLNNTEANQYGFQKNYLSKISENWNHISGYSGLKTITFLQYTIGKFHFLELSSITLISFY